MAQDFSIARYTLFPEFWPRLRELFTSGFGFTAYLIAQLFQTAGLLPNNHPYLNPQNIGQYNIRNVLAQGANYLVFKRENIDQILLYGAVLSGIVIILVQIALFVIAAIAQEPAMAQLVPPGDVLTTDSQYNPGPEQDIVFMMLDRVFGTQGIFDSCISTNVPCLDMQGEPLPIANTQPYPTAFHLALHTLMRFYSWAMFIVGFIILGYFVVAMVAETTVFGTPFGKRMNKIWYPLRFMLFFALLIPLNLGEGDRNAGLNAGQIITLWSAKVGSNFATNGWNRFLQTLQDSDARTDTFIGDGSGGSDAGQNLVFNDNFVATPTIPELGNLIQFMMVAKTCAIAEEVMFQDPAANPVLHDVDAYIVREPQIIPIIDNSDLLDDDVMPFIGTDFTLARQFSKFGNIIIRFGVKGHPADPNIKDFENYKGNVSPTCGDLILPILSDDKIDGTIRSGISGTTQMQKFYYENVVQDLWEDTTLAGWSMCIARAQIHKIQMQRCDKDEMPTANTLRQFVTDYEKELRDNLADFVEKQEESTVWTLSQTLKDKGWGAAAIWYNRIAQMNGELIAAVYNVPQPSQYPLAMKNIADQQMLQSKNIDAASAFDMTLPDGRAVEFKRGSNERQAALAMVAAFKLWEKDGFQIGGDVQTTGNAIIDTINLVFGTAGLFDMRKNADVHPLGQLSALGRGMMEATIRNLGIGIVGGGVGKMFVKGNVAQIAGTLFYGFAMMTIALSFVLYYILPFLPFIYFFFAVATWVKTIFEAIVAMPLWALAHISRIDGEGLPGQAAMNGYVLIFEIFLRPILIVFGLIASVLIFSSMVVVLNEIFDMVVENVSGFNLNEKGVGTTAENFANSMRAPVDEFFYTVLYTIIVYIIGLSAFKLIDAIPQQILRWMGQQVKTFQDTSGSGADGLVQRSYSGIKIASGNFQGGLLAGLV